MTQETKLSMLEVEREMEISDWEMMYSWNMIDSFGEATVWPRFDDDSGHVARRSSPVAPLTSRKFISLFMDLVAIHIPLLLNALSMTEILDAL